jgi:tRNA(fMet)-specific endonuclease VapC
VLDPGREQRRATHRRPSLRPGMGEVAVGETECTRRPLAKIAKHTSTVIMLPRISDPLSLPADPLITTVTLAELSVGPLVARDEGERSARQAHVQQAETDFEPLPFDRSSAQAFGHVAASLRRSGRKTGARAYDAMIAATAMANGLAIYTCNPDDFSGIDGLTVVTVAVPAETTVE